jgi:hypothetical protein
VNQPHGLDYRAWNHLALAVQNRMQKGHKAFGDSTAGGEHIPGGAGIVGMEISDAGGDCTPVVDGTYKGRGLVWAYDGSTGVLWCSTTTAEATTCDWTVLQLHPNASWCGQDVTWAGDHVFAGSACVAGGFYVDSSVDVSQLAVDGSVDVSGALDCSVLYVDQSADVSDLHVDGDISIDGVLKVDGTATQFGGTAGIGLFYDPTSYTGAASKETITFPNGMILKAGKKAYADPLDVSFAAAFPNGVVSAQVTANDTGGSDAIVTTPNISAFGVTGFTVRWDSAVIDNAYWIAIGY